MTIFSENGFHEGKWAGKLAKSLKGINIIHSLYPKARIWRADWKQWIQFEEKGLGGPIFWLGKPAIISDENRLYAGYYVERGLPENISHAPEYIFTSKWHWNGFIKCLEDNNLRLQINSLLKNLPKRRCIWINTNINKYTSYFDYDDESSLLETKKILNEISSELWIDLILGVSFSKEECINLQEDIIHEIRFPIIQAFHISEIVKNVIEENND